MTWSEQVFRYCERGQDPGFWAEPFNAASNAGFLIAGAVLWARFASAVNGAWFHPSSAGSAGTAAAHVKCENANHHTLVWLLIVLTFAVGIGSFLFHTFATRWARLADVVPISLFMGAYLYFALRVFLGWSLTRTIVAVLGFAAVGLAASTIACPASMRSVTDYAREPCLKGAMGYVPALLALLVTGAALRRDPVLGRQLLVAAGIFLAAMILRWVDRDMCATTILFGQARGTHALWHLLTATAVYVLVSLAIDSLARGRPLQTRA